MNKTHKKLHARRFIGQLTIMCMVANPVFAASIASNTLPTNGQVVGGNASISTTANKETITQSTNSAIINWSSFNVGSAATVAFDQPNTKSVTLNRVTNSQSPSQILGNVTSNGTVMLVNSHGVIFGKGSQVNVGGLLATSSDIDNADFMNGNYNFKHPGDPNAKVSNAGNIIVHDAGLAALVGPNVDNSGYIEATLGRVQLASGDSFSVDLYGDGLFNLQASSQLTKQIVENSGTIKANGGQVLLTAAAAQGIVNSLINMDGIVEADSIGSKNGTVTLYAAGSNAVANNVAANKGKAKGSSTVVVSGTVSAKGAQSGTTGGTVKVLADNVDIQSTAKIDASGAAGGGNVQIGGDMHGGGTTPTAANTNVESGATILANATDAGNGGNVSVWADNTTNFDGTIEAKAGPNGGDGGYVETSGAATLDVNGTVDAAGSATGAAGTWLLDPSSNLTISNSPNSGSNVSVATIDGELNFAGTTNVDVMSGGNITVENNITKTAGGIASLTLDAANNIIVNPNVTISSTHNKLFVTLLANGTVTLKSGSSIISNNATIVVASNAFVNDSGANALQVGNDNWYIFTSSPSADTFGNLNSNNTAIWGSSFGDAITESGNRYIFAFQPTLTFTSINDSKTYGQNYVSTVAGDYTVSGLQSGVAGAFLGDTVATAFSGGPKVTSAGSAATANVSNSPYAIDVALGTLKSLEGYKFAFASTGKLTVNPKELTVTPDAVSTTYNGVALDKKAYSDDLANYDISGFVNGQNATSAGIKLHGSLAFDGSTTESVLNAGSYSMSEGTLSLKSKNSNYALNFVNGGETPNAYVITPASLTISAVTDSKVYNGTTDSSAAPTFTGLVKADAGDLTGLTQSFTSKDVLGTDGSTLTVTKYTLTDPENYNVTLNSATGTITPAALTLSAATDTKVYDGTTGSSKSPTVGTTFSTDTVTGLGQAFASKDVLGTDGSTLNVTGFTVNDGNGGRDYNVTLNSATGTITPASLTIAAASDTKVYDGTTSSSQTPTVGTTFSTDTVSGLGQTFASKDVLGPNGSTLNVTGFTVNDGNGGKDYNVTLASATGTITPASVSVTADNQSKALGAPVPPLTFSFGALQGSDTSSVFSGALTTTAAADSLPGNFPITQGSLAAGADYSISFTPGTLFVSPISDQFNSALLRVASNGARKPITGTLLALVTAPTPPPSLPNLAPAAGGNINTPLADLSPSAGGPSTGGTPPTNTLANLSPSAGDNTGAVGSVSALIECNAVTPCESNQ